MKSSDILKLLTTFKSSITLHPSEAETTSLFLQHPGRYFSSLDLRNIGIVGPHQCIYRLKAKGAIIETILKPVLDGSGKYIKIQAWYKLIGWIQHESS